MNNSDKIKNMFESIKESLNSTRVTGDSAYRNFLRMEAGKTYLVRLVPNIEDPKSTFFHYAHHGFTSLSTGQYVDATCPRVFGERCPICELRFKLYKTKQLADKELAYAIRAHEKHLVNVFVISDPTNPDNEYNVRILRYGTRLHDKILSATEGDDADEFGTKIYDLTEKGCNFKIKAEVSTDGKRKFINYNNSRFTAPSAILNMDAEKIQSAYENIFDLTKILEMKTEDELNKIISEHILCENKKDIETKDKEDDDQPSELVYEQSQEMNNEETDKKEPSKTETAIKNLLDGLDNL